MLVYHAQSEGCALVAGHLLFREHQQLGAIDRLSHTQHMTQSNLVELFVVAIVDVQMVAGGKQHEPRRELDHQDGLAVGH